MPMIYERTLAGAATPMWDFRDPAAGGGDQPWHQRHRRTQGRSGPAVRGRVPRAGRDHPRALPDDADPVHDRAAHQRRPRRRSSSGHIRAVVQTRAAAGDTRIALFDRIVPQTPDKAACAYHPNVAAERASWRRQLGGRAARAPRLVTIPSFRFPWTCEYCESHGRSGHTGDRRPRQETTMRGRARG